MTMTPNAYLWPLVGGGLAAAVGGAAVGAGAAMLQDMISHHMARRACETTLRSMASEGSLQLDVRNVDCFRKGDAIEVSDKAGEVDLWQADSVIQVLLPNSLLLANPIKSSLAKGTKIVGLRMPDASKANGTSSLGAKEDSLMTLSSVAEGGVASPKLKAAVDPEQTDQTRSGSLLWIVPVLVVIASAGAVLLIVGLFLHFTRRKKTKKAFYNRMGASRNSRMSRDLEVMDDGRLMPSAMDGHEQWHDGEIGEDASWFSSEEALQDNQDAYLMRGGNYLQ